MKRISAFILLFCALGSAQAGSTINAVNRFAYGANIGWMDWRADVTNGAVIGEYVCSGSIYSANVGWISLGNGAPTNGIHYQNLSSNDFGVNMDCLGNLRGYAYGANIGWINFESNGAPRVDMATGRFTGSAYSANCGWISLSNAFAFVQTDVIAPAQVCANGLPFAWQQIHFGTTGVDPCADPDCDGMSNLQEYFAGTNPNSKNDCLRLTDCCFTPGGTNATLTWASVPAGYYYIQKAPDPNSTSWVDSGLGMITSDGYSTTRTFADSNAPARFYRILAVWPIGP